MKKIAILLVSLLFLGGCGEAKLIDGKEAIVTFNDKEEGITAEDLYSALKETYGTEFITDMIDTYLLNDKYEEDDEQKTYVNQVIKSVKDYATENNYNYLDYVKNSYGVSSEKAFKDYISLNYKRNKYTEEYAETIVTDKQINEYYEAYTIGDIKASHILITANVKDDATDEEKTAAETAAKEKAQSIIKELDGGADFAELAKKYSEDSANAEKGGDLDYFNRGVMDQAFEDAAVALEIGKYSSTPVKSQFGYHIIYKTDQKEKPSLKDSKETIIKTVAKELLQANSGTMYLEAMENLRNSNKMDIVDSELKDGYEENMIKLKSGRTN